MNILLTSVGRRSYMVDYFKEALQSVGGKVYAANSEQNSPALYTADEYVISPLIYDEKYESFILNYCLKNDISVLISLFDIELPKLSTLKDKFKKNGILIIVGDSWLTEMANDKWQTFQFLKANNFLTKDVYLNLPDCKTALKNKLLDFPVFVKPRWGMGSIAVYKAYSIEELDFYFNAVKKVITNSYLKFESALDFENSVIIQPAFLGFEYGLDIINDLNGDYQTTIVKRKIAMRSGETDAATTVFEPILEQLGKEISNLTKHPANMDVDVFFDGTEAYVLELNPRFGGGYPFSHMAGVNLPEAIIKWYNMEKVEISSCLKPKIGITSMKGISMITQIS